MSEWGKYLKNAVANVEQQLDKVLQENQESQEAAAPKQPRTRTDLAERLKLAAAGKSSPRSESNESYSEDTERERTPDVAVEKKVGIPETLVKVAGGEGHPTSGPIVTPLIKNDENRHRLSEASLELKTLKEFIVPLDFSRVLKQAKSIALNYRNEETLALVDTLEIVVADIQKYETNVGERLLSIHSKLALLSGSEAAYMDGSAKKITLLLEEGQRLSQQELKLGMLLKRLRAEKSDLLAKVERAGTDGQAAITMRNDFSQAKTHIRELEAVNSHLKAQLEEEQARRADQPSNQRGAESQDIGGSQLFKERLEWQRLESELLHRISDLEETSGRGQSSKTQLQENLNAAREAAREFENKTIQMQDDLDDMKAQHRLRESRLTKEIETLKAEQLRLEQRRVDDLKRIEDQQKEIIPTSEEVVLNTLSNGPVTPLAASPSADSAAHSMRSRKRSSFKSSVARSLIDGSTFSHNTPFTFEYDEQALGPAGPFGVNMDIMDGATPPPNLPDVELDTGLYGIENERPDNLSRDFSNIDDSFGGLQSNQSRLGSVADPLNDTGNSHLVKKLTLSVRKLQNDLSVAKHEADIARQQRQESLTEVVKFVELEQQFEALQGSHNKLQQTHTTTSAKLTELETMLSDRNEQVSELEADVRDLKDMYKEQVETLIAEIELGKKN